MLEGPVYLHVHELAGTPLAFGHGHVDHVAPRIAALPFVVLLRPSLARSLKKHVGHKAYAAFEPCFGPVVLKALEPLQPLKLHFVGDLERHGRGARARSVGIAEGKARHEAAAVYGLQRVLEFLFRFRREAHDEIRGKRDVGPGLSESLHNGEIAFHIVAAPHLLQHGIRAGLKRQMQSGAELRKLGEHVDGLLREVAGMRGHETDAPKTRNGRHLTQKLGERGTVAALVVAEHVDVLPGA